MKRRVWMAVSTALLLGVAMASAQSLGDTARAARKAKPQQSTARHFDNDNLPTNQPVSVVGPAPSSNANSNATDESATKKDSAKDGKEAQPAKEAGNAASDGKTPAPEAKKDKSPADALKSRVEDQKQKIDALSKDLDITQREYRLRAVEMYSDAGNRLRNAAQWDKEDAQYKKDIADKQQALDAAKQQLTDLEEQERTADAPPDKQ